MLSAMQQIGCDLQHGLITDSSSQNVFFVSSAHALVEKRNGEEAFLPAVIYD